ncbi:DNA-binding response regulator [Sesbania bispinosa]|nr:DNA-binding response regulator [Sesbania bispinosa]
MAARQHEKLAERLARRTLRDAQKKADKPEMSQSDISVANPQKRKMSKGGYPGSATFEQVGW